jgi:hypothetical protein
MIFKLKFGGENLFSFAMTSTIEGNNSVGSLLKEVTLVVGSRMLCSMAIAIKGNPKCDGLHKPPQSTDATSKNPSIFPQTQKSINECTADVDR